MGHGIVIIHEPRSEQCVTFIRSIHLACAVPVARNSAAILVRNSFFTPLFSIIMTPASPKKRSCHRPINTFGFFHAIM